MNSKNLLSISLSILFLAGSSNLFSQSVIPLPAHSHNDYEQPRALFSALQLRFASVEADVFLVDDTLLVGHEEGELMPGRTLGNLYLEPLRLLAMRNAGQIYSETTAPLILIVDVKSEAEATYQQLERELAPYEDMLTKFTPDSTELGAVTVVVSGNKAQSIMEQQAERYSAYDGSIEALTSGSINSNFSPVVSSAWGSVFEWRGNGPMPDDERQQLNTLSQLALENGVKLRFWGTLDIPPVWDALTEAGVSLIGADRIDELSQYLNR